MTCGEPAIAPGLIVQFPGVNPLNSTLPCSHCTGRLVIIPTTGAVGVAG